MAATLICDMGDLPPEARQQITEKGGGKPAAGAAADAGKQAATPRVIPTPKAAAGAGSQAAADTAKQGVVPRVIPAPGHGAAQARRPAAGTGSQAADGAAQVKKRGALIQRRKAVAPGDELVSMNVRLTREAYDAVQDLADEYGVSKAMVIRLALSGNMGDHLGTVRYTDPQVEAELRRAAARIGDASAEIGHQLRRIGKNYNDALKLAHIEAKRGGKAAAPELDTELVKSLIERYEAAAERTDEAIWRILK